MPCHHSWGRDILYLASLTLPALMRSLISNYRIVFRPAVHTASVLGTIATYLFQNYPSALIRCRVIQSFVLIKRSGSLVLWGIVRGPILVSYSWYRLKYFIIIKGVQSVRRCVHCVLRHQYNRAFVIHLFPPKRLYEIV